MKTLHWMMVSIMIISLLGIPYWYVKSGRGAAPIPGPEVQALRSSHNRNVVGGGSRLGK